MEQKSEFFDVINCKMFINLKYSEILHSEIIHHLTIGFTTSLKNSKLLSVDDNIFRINDKTVSGCVIQNTNQLCTVLIRNDVVTSDVSRTLTRPFTSSESSVSVELNGFNKQTVNYKFNQIYPPDVVCKDPDVSSIYVAKCSDHKIKGNKAKVYWPKSVFTIKKQFDVTRFLFSDITFNIFMLLLGVLLMTYSNDTSNNTQNLTILILTIMQNYNYRKGIMGDNLTSIDVIYLISVILISVSFYLNKYFIMLCVATIYFSFLMLKIGRINLKIHHENVVKNIAKDDLSKSPNFVDVEGSEELVNIG